MAEVYNWEEKRGGLMCGYNHCLQVNDREFCLITKALMGYAEIASEYEEIHAVVTLIKDMAENRTKVDSNPLVIRKETFRKVFEVDDDVEVIIRVEGSDES